MAPTPRDGKKLVMSGLYPATVTPFTAGGALDKAALAHHIEATFAAPDVNGVVVNSGLGEILQLTSAEKIEAIGLALKYRKPGQIVLAGVEGHDIELVIRDALDAKNAGAEAILVFPPFDRRAYRRLAAHPASVRAFFARLDKEIDLPMVVFQYPPNSHCAYSVDALKAIADLPNVVAIKVATAGDLPAYKAVWDALKDDLAILVGVDSPPLIDMLRYGSHGALIGISAIVPEKWSALLGHVSRGEDDAADALFDRVCRPLMSSVFENQQPKRLTSEAAAVKEALFQLGEIPHPGARAPAFPVNDEVRREIREALESAGLLHRSAA